MASLFGTLGDSMRVADDNDELVIVNHNKVYHTCVDETETYSDEDTLTVEKVFSLSELEEAKLEVDRLQADGEEDRVQPEYYFGVDKVGNGTHSTYQLFRVPTNRFYVGDKWSPDGTLVYTPPKRKFVIVKTDEEGSTVQQEFDLVEKGDAIRTIVGLRQQEPVTYDLYRVNINAVNVGDVLESPIPPTSDKVIWDPCEE